METKNADTKARRVRILCTLAPLAALMAGFAYWLYQGGAGRIASLVAAAALLFLFAVCLIRLVPQWQRAWSGDPLPAYCPEGGRRSARRARMHPFFKIAAAVALSRVLLFVAAYLIACRSSGYSGGVFDRLDLWNPERCDSRGYLWLAEHWYTAAGSERFYLALFPFYPAVLRVLNYIFQNHLVTGLFVSNVALVFAACLLYELTLFDADRSTGLRAVKYLCIQPGCLPLSTPLPHSLFLLLSIACLYLVRKKRYAFAALTGMFAAFTLPLGILLLLPALMELIGDCIADRKLSQSGRALFFAYLPKFLSLLLIPVGLGLYLWINVQVSGEPFRFVSYQAEYWNHRLSFFFNTAAYQTTGLMQALGNGNVSEAIGLWGPNLAYLFGSLAILIPAVPRLRSSYTAYFLLYFALAAGSTGLLSAPRILTAAFPLPLALACASGKRWADLLLTLLCLGGLAIYLYAGVMQWHVF